MIGKNEDDNNISAQIAFTTTTTKQFSPKQVGIGSRIKGSVVVVKAEMTNFAYSPLKYLLIPSVGGSKWRGALAQR
jgi:hypothetical protein